MLLIIKSFERPEVSSWWQGFKIIIKMYILAFNRRLSDGSFALIFFQHMKAVSDAYEVVVTSPLITELRNQ